MASLFIMWKVDIINSESIDRYFTGVTDTIAWRLERHYQGWSKYTKRGIPWRVVYTEDFEVKTDALKREREKKKRRSKIYIESLLKI